MEKERNPTEKKLQLTEHHHCNGDLESRYEQDHLTYPMFQNPVRKVRVGIIGGLVVMGIIIVIALAAALAVVMSKPCMAPPDLPAAPWCPKGWIGYEGKCYYFSEAEGNWTNSQRHCSALSASLAVIDTGQDLGFIHRYKGPSEHWIGLSRDPDKLWKWVNGQEFNNMFEVRGGGECAYLNDAAVSSSWCSTLRHWVCSKAAGSTERGGLSVQGHSGNE